MDEIEAIVSSGTKLNLESISIEVPEDADRYQEVPLSQLLPPEDETP
jgi:hypothetical protein